MRKETNTIEEVFLKAYEEHADAIFRYCFFQTSNREVALDLSQDTFTKTWLYIKDGEKVDNIKAFLYRVAKNLIIDHWRKKKSSSLDQMLADGFDYEDNNNLFEMKEAESEGGELLNKITDLPDSYKQILTLRFIDDLDITEISKRTGLTENNVSVKIHRGLQKLNDLVTEKHESR